MTDIFENIIIQKFSLRAFSIQYLMIKLSLCKIDIELYNILNISLNLVAMQNQNMYSFHNLMSLLCMNLFSITSVMCTYNEMRWVTVYWKWNSFLYHVQSATEIQTKEQTLNVYFTNIPIKENAEIILGGIEVNKSDTIDP